jgi:magnesium chelatase family protein
MLSKIFSSSVEGVEAQLITIEIDIALGLLQWHMVGLPDLAIKESKERIIAAIRNSGIKFPDRKITINLSPADIKKRGSMFDFAIVIGLLDAAGIISIPHAIQEQAVFIGEIGLDGGITDAKGALVIAADLKKMNKSIIFVPFVRRNEVALIDGITIFAPKTISECIAWFQGGNIYQQVYVKECRDDVTIVQGQSQSKHTSLDDVYGNEEAKRAVQIALAGRHNILFIGSPGSGKTFLAEQMKHMLPRLDIQEQIEITKIYASCFAGVQSSLIVDRPFVSPHHSISTVGLIGGGSYPKPGAITLAHCGILFLDELLEYKKSSLESLRQPLESKHITITRAQAEYTFPANFLLVAATNPCPCGYYGDKRNSCVCSQRQVAQYMSKLSGPLLDRIDLHVGVYGSHTVFADAKRIDSTCSHDTIVAGMYQAIANQQRRYQDSKKRNGDLQGHEVKQIVLSPEAKNTVEKLYHTMHLSMRSYFKIVKIARTIADIDSVDIVEKKHIIEASRFRIVDLLVK